MYSLRTSKKYDKDYVLAAKRGYNIKLLNDVVFQLINNSVLNAKQKNHKLSGKYSNCWECHITPDWLLIYQKDDSNQTLLLLRTGTHSDLF
jgi:mRNA interferase YafQ